MTAQERLGIRIKELRAKNPTLTASQCHDMLVSAQTCSVPNLAEAQAAEHYMHEHRNGYH